MNLRHGTAALLPHQRKACLRIFNALKNPLPPLVRIEPAMLESRVKCTTTGPLRATDELIYCPRIHQQAVLHILCRISTVPDHSYSTHWKEAHFFAPSLSTVIFLLATCCLPFISLPHMASHYAFTLKMATAVFARTLVNS
jgi:hypothetical protein